MPPDYSCAEENLGWRGGGGGGGGEIEEVAYDYWIGWTAFTIGTYHDTVLALIIRTVKNNLIVWLKREAREFIHAITALAIIMLDERKSSSHSSTYKSGVAGPN